MAKFALARARRGFTLVELLVVIGIIVLLIAILLPVVSQVRLRAYAANTQSEMQRIMQACLSYYHDFNSYPGPLSNQEVDGGPNIAITGLSNPKITSSENLVLGLLGYLSAPGQLGGNPLFAVTPPQTPHDVSNLNPLQPRSYHYIDFVAEELSGGFAYGSAGVQRTTDTKGGTATAAGTPTAETITDTNVPEFMDHIPDPMPILYVRTNRGAPGSVANGMGGGSSGSLPQYDRSQLGAYGFTEVNMYDYPLPPLAQFTMTDSPEWTAYFLSTTASGQVKGKDTFMLISAGVDRLYGTKDDIVVTP